MAKKYSLTCDNKYFYTKFSRNGKLKFVKNLNTTLTCINTSNTQKMQLFIIKFSIKKVTFSSKMRNVKTSFNGFDSCISSNHPNSTEYLTNIQKKFLTPKIFSKSFQKFFEYS